jgi:hypothetical protein
MVIWTFFLFVVDKCLVCKLWHILTHPVHSTVSWRMVSTATLDHNWFSKLTSSPNIKAESILVRHEYFTSVRWIQCRPCVEISKTQASFCSTFIFYFKFLIVGCSQQADKNVPVPWEEAACGLLRRPLATCVGHCMTVLWRCLVYQAYIFHSSEKFMSDGKV